MLANKMFLGHFSHLLLAFSLIITSGCSSLINNQATKFADNLSNSILNSNDPQTIAQAMPTFIVLADSLAKNSPESPGLNAAAAKLYSTYAGVFVEDDPDRQIRLAKTGYDYAKLAACNSATVLCDFNTGPFDAMQELKLDDDQWPFAYQLAVSWLGYIQANSGDWALVAELPRVTFLLQKIVETNEQLDNGGAHLYLGAIATLLPPNLGGKPDIGKEHFERAIALSEGRNLIVKVEYARRYARLLFDQELHHRLLTEVMESPVQAGELTLSNALAKQQAALLLADEAEYF